MKKVIVLFILMLSVTSGLYAGWSTTTRSKCHWWSHRFASDGHISTFHCGWQYSYSHSSGCDNALVDFTRNWCCNANATVHAQSNWGGQWGYFYGACSMGGQMFSDLFTELAPDGGDGSQDDPGYSPGRNEAQSIPNLDDPTGSHVVSISGISISLSSDVNDPKDNTYTLAIWQPQDDTINGEDTVYAASKAIVTGTVSILGGKVTVSGDLFTQGDFQVQNNGQIVMVNYVGGDKTVQIDAQTNIDNLAVSGIGDIGDNQQAKFSQAVNTNNGVVSGDIYFNAFPNPVSNVLNLTFKSQKTTTISVSVYDATGKLVMQKNDIGINNGITNSSINTNSLAAGQYFILAEGKGIKVIKQITKQ